MNNYTYLIRRKVFKIFGASFHIYDPQDNLIGFSNQKAFKLKEDIRIYTDESMNRELLVIKAQNIIDFSAGYDVFEADSNLHLGTWKRKGIASIMRDTWLLFDAAGNQIAELKEDNLFAALTRRFVCKLIPQSYNLDCVDGSRAAIYEQNFNPFVFKLGVTVVPQSQIKPHLILAGGILLAAIEGRQN